MNEGVDGMTNRMGLLSVPGVWMVKPRLLGFLLGGVGGLTKEGELGTGDVDSFFTSGKDAEEAARPAFNKLDVFTARFFRFLGFLAGVVGR